MGISGIFNSISSVCSNAWASATSTRTGKVAIAVGIGVTAVALAKCAYDYFSKPSEDEPRIEQRREAPAKLPSPEEYIESTTETIKLSKKVIAFEEGDHGKLYDPSLNSIPGTCFEIGSALSILESPGAAGVTMDRFAGNLSEALDRIYHTSLGDTVVLHNGREKTLRAVFDEKLLKEVRPSSDQIGRCTHPDLEEDWYRGQGLTWLQSQLTLPSTDPSYTHNNMLTKVRMISAFGTVLRELTPIPGNQEALARVLNKDSVEVIPTRYATVVENLRHEAFDNPQTRARAERPPIIDGQSLGKRPLQSAGPLGLGFGQVYGPESFPGQPELWERYQEVEKASGGRQGLEREGQPIHDLNRPGNVSEYGLARMPQAFKKAGLPHLMKEKAFFHGTGVNRWDLTGTYARESWLHGLPSAGAHSGGTVDILLALDCLSDESIFGNRDTVLQSGLLISSFMNFGGYHSFNETFPIAQAYANGERFVVNGSRPAPALYASFAEATHHYAPQAHERVSAFQDAYHTAFRDENTTKTIRKDVAKLQLDRTPGGAWEVS